MPTKRIEKGGNGFKGIVEKGLLILLCLSKSGSNVKMMKLARSFCAIETLKAAHMRQETAKRTLTKMASLGDLAKDMSVMSE